MVMVTDMTIMASRQATTVSTRARTEEDGESSWGLTIRASTRLVCVAMPGLTSNLDMGFCCTPRVLLHPLFHSLGYRRALSDLPHVFSVSRTVRPRETNRCLASVGATLFTLFEGAIKLQGCLFVNPMSIGLVVFST